MWNPFAYWRDERAKDREAQLSALALILESNNRSSEVAIEQSRALRAFIDSFLTITDLPVRRVSTDESEAELEIERWGVHGES